MDNEEAIRHEKQEVPVRFQGLYRRAVAGTSRAASIKCMCLECQGWNDGVVAAVRDCVSRACPLWAVRPYQVGGEAEAEEAGEEAQVAEGGDNEA